MKIINIFYTFFNKQLPPATWKRYMQHLPADQQERNNRYQRWQDKHAHLLGRLLLAYGWWQIAKNNPLDRVQYDNWGRPFIVGSIDFNISHAGNYVVCAIGESVKVGVDIEQVKNMELSDLKDVMNQQQWADIEKSPVPAHTFLRYWTMKEATIKADGRGLSFPFANIHFNENMAIIEGNTWFLYELSLAKEYYVWLACNTKVTEVKIELCEL